MRENNGKNAFSEMAVINGLDSNFLKLLNCDNGAMIIDY